MTDAQLYDETFNITGLLTGKYDRVHRITGTSTDGTTTMSLDINIELYPVAQDDNIQLVLASTLNLDGTKDERGAAWRDIGRQGGDASLADMFDYVCYGKIYRFQEGADETSDNISVYVSFGGLLLYINGPYKKLTSLRIDYVYLLLKK